MEVLQDKSGEETRLPITPERTMQYLKALGKVSASALEPQNAEDSLKAGKYDRAIAYALIDITEKLDMIAQELRNLAKR
jgi:hypothetical protein